MQTIELINITKTYSNEVVALKDINLTINNKEPLAILGESGSGKTTLAKIIAQVIDFTEGTLLFDDETPDLNYLKSGRIVYVDEHSKLFPHMIIFDNIAYPLKLQGISFEEINRRVIEVASLFDISFLLTRKPKQISKGQQQLAILAKMWIKNPLLIILDEPFKGIDLKRRTNIRKLLKKLLNSYQGIFIIVTHDINDALLLSKKVVFLKEGSIIDVLKVEEVSKSTNPEIVKLVLGDVE